MQDRREAAADLHGFTDVKGNTDFIDEFVNNIEKFVNKTGSAQLKREFNQVTKDKVSEELRNRYVAVDPLNNRVSRQYYVNRDNYSETHRIIDLNSDFAEIYTPCDNFYDTPSGGDTSGDFGRIPVEELMAICSLRMGCVYHACNKVARDVYRNKFDIIEFDAGPDDKPVEKPIIKTLKIWMRKSHFWTYAMQQLDFERRSGNGYLIGYWNSELKDAKDAEGNKISIIPKYHERAPTTKPDFFQAFSNYHVLPTNISDTKLLDYDKRKWRFQGGIINSSEIDNSRLHVLETRREEWAMRGLAIAEPVWVPLICRMNTMYFILKGLALLGTHTVGFMTEKEFPTAAECTAYTTLAGQMRANKCYVFGKGGQLKIENAASAIGSGITEFIEFLNEDISSAWVIPKNQLFGRADGGGLEGAGALVSKEDYLTSIGGIQQDCTDDIMDILVKKANFKELEEYSIRWNLDLHKTTEQRLKEEMMKLQLEQLKMNTELMKSTTKLQLEMAKVQEKLFKQNPEQFMLESQLDEENTEKADANYEPKEPNKKPKASEPKKSKDFVDYLDRPQLVEYLNTLKTQFTFNVRQMQANSLSIMNEQRYLVENYAGKNKLNYNI